MECRKSRIKIVGMYKILRKRSCRLHAASGGVRRKPIADAKLSEQNAGTRGVPFDLLAKPAHEDSEVMRILHMVDPPDPVQQVLMGDDVAGMPWYSIVVSVMTLVIGLIHLRDTRGVDIISGSGVALQGRRD
jgi:hypothetical protein